ncbi:MAG: histidinol-phosphate transaminase [bacterium]
MSKKKLVRKNILKMQSYLPGKPIKEVQRELGIKDIVKLASNENSFTPPRRVIDAVKKELSSLNRYPEGSGIYLRQALSRKLGVPTDYIILGNGTDEIIELIGKTFVDNNDEIIVSEGAFIRYEMVGDLMGCRVVSVPMKNFTHDLRGFRKAITQRTKVVFIANPNNPTGTYVSKKEVEWFLKSVPSRVLVVFDEAYYEYVQEKDYPQTIPYVKKLDNVIVLRTFSKIYSLAGLRIGYGVAVPELIDYLNRIRPPFNTSTVAQAAAQAALSDKEHLKKTLKFVAEGKRFLYAKLKEMGLAFVPSAANFILVDVGRKSKEVFMRILKEGVIVRAMEEYGFGTYIRVTIGLEKENKKFLKALTKVLSR